MSITLNQTQLRAWDACRGGREEFHEHFPRGLRLTRKNVGRLAVLEPAVISWGYEQLLRELADQDVARVVAGLADDVSAVILGLSDDERAALRAVFGPAARGETPAPITGSELEMFPYPSSAINTLLAICDALAELPRDLEKLCWQANNLIFYILDNLFRGLPPEYRAAWLLERALARYLEGRDGAHD